MATNEIPSTTIGPGDPATTDVVDFRCEHCAASLPVDSPTYEDILANGCFVCEAPAGAGDFRRRPA